MHSFFVYLVRGGLAMNFNLSHIICCSESTIVSVSYFMTLTVPNLLVGFALLAAHVAKLMKHADINPGLSFVSVEINRQSFTPVDRAPQYFGSSEGNKSDGHSDV